MAAITRAAPAKINLALHVTGRRADGFHSLESLVCFAGVGDEVSITPAPADRLTLDGPFAAGVPSGADNLVLQALELFRDHWPGRLPQGVEIGLTKALPPAAGLGGGSADAAATLKALAEMAGMADARAELAELAQQLGADVPVCLEGVPAIMTGIGEIVEPVDLPDFALVLANARQLVSTAEVFARLETCDNPPLPARPPTFDSFDALTDWLGRTRNDLTPAADAIAPAIAALTDSLAATDECAFARMSGSGATVFGIFPTLESAERAARQLASHWPDTWVVATGTFAQ